MTTRVLILVIAALTAFGVTGCSNAMSRPMPQLSETIAVKVSPDPPVRFGEMPVFVYHIPDTSVYVAGHEGAAAIGGLFGIVGVAVAMTAARAAGASKVRDYEAQLRVDVRALTESLLLDAVTRPVLKSRLAPATEAGSVFEISPFLVVNFVNDRVRPWVVLKVVLKNAQGDQTWKTKYAAGVGELRMLGGPNGWASEDGAPLRMAIDRNLRLAMDVFLRDIAGEFPRGRGRAMNVTTQWVWMRLPSEEPVEVLHETEETLVVIPQGRENFFAGVSVLDKRSVGLDRE